MILLDMDMPKDCEECALCHRAFDGNETRLACYGLGTWCFEDERLDNCPLHEVTDSDTISRQAAYDTLTEYYHHKTDIQHKALSEALSRVPSSPSRQRGRWEMVSQHENPPT